MKKKGLKALVLVLTACLTAASLSACTTYDAFYNTFIDPQEETYETVKFGVYEPLSGTDKQFGELEREGIELAHSVQPTCLKKDVELIYADSQSDLDIAETAIRELIEKGPTMIFGSYGSVYSLVAAKYIEDAKIPTIAITNKNPLVTHHNPYYFRVCYVDSYQGTALAKYVTESMGLTSAVIMREYDDDVASALSQAFEEKLVSLTGNQDAVAMTVEFMPGTTDFTDQLQRILRLGVTAVLLPVSEQDAVQIISQAKALGLVNTFIGTDEWNTETFASSIGDAADMAVFATTYDPETEVNETAELFLRAYHEKYGEDAVPPPEVALGFDAYMIAVESINRIGTVRDPELLLKSLLLTHQYPGASGNITLDINGDAMKTVVVKGVKDGEFHNIYTMEPAFE